MARNPISSVAPMTLPPLMPPPAIHIVKPFGFVIAALAALRSRRAAELARPHHERFVELPARLEILEQRCDRLVYFPGLAERAFVGVVVMVPVFAVTAAGN